jgi:hypothetical protein
MCLEVKKTDDVRTDVVVLFRMAVKWMQSANVKPGPGCCFMPSHLFFEYLDKSKSPVRACRTFENKDIPPIPTRNTFIHHHMNIILRKSKYLVAFLGLSNNFCK